MGFATPTRTSAGREYFQLRNYEGELLVFEVDKYDEAYVNERFKKDGARPTIWAKVIVVTGDEAGKVWPREEVNAQYVVEALADHVGGDPVLGRLNRGSQGGKGAPFFFNEPDDEDIETAEAFFDDFDEDAATGGDADDDTPPWEE